MITAKDILDLGDGMKVILLMEQAPLTDRFAQIMLTQAEFKAMREGLWKALPPSEGAENMRQIITSDRYSDISIPNIPALYTAEQKQDPKL